LWSYEVGAKSQFAGGRLSASAAAFRMDWSNIQQTTILAECMLPLTTNAGKARIKGGEIEIGGRPFADVPLTLQLGVGYTDARLIDPGILDQVPNSRLGSVPRWTGTVSGYYEAPLRDDVSLFMAADYSYTSSTTVLTVTDTEGHFVSRSPINLVNANFGVNVGPAQIMFYVKNLFDKRLNLGHQTSRAFERQDENGQQLSRGVVSRPRQMGVQVHLSF
jgi:outer membrane receptor protein involved in Fe transport